VIWHCKHIATIMLSAAEALPAQFRSSASARVIFSSVIFDDGGNGLPQRTHVRASSADSISRPE
jgi:hypothetical protein